MIYAVVPLGENEGLEARLRATTDDLYDELKPNLYFLVYDGSPAALRRDLGLGDRDGGGEGVVLRVGHHDGYTNRSLWDWIEEERR